MVPEELVLDQALRSIEEWRTYVLGLSRTDIDHAETILADAVVRFEATLSHLGYARSILKGRAEKLDKEQQALERKKRSQRARMSLRDFLSRSPLAEDLRLAEVPLCTKSGATVLLEGLFFGQQLVETVNDARRLLQQGNSCTARWKLHYVKGGNISAPFAWDRPFLDQLFVLPYGA